MLVNLHNHTPLCRHARGEPAEYVQRAMETGSRVFGFADHLPYPPGFVEPAPDCAILPETFPEYLASVNALRRIDRKGMSVLIGVEVDHVSDRTEWTINTVKSLDIDYAIGSIHILRGMAVDYTRPKLEELVRECGGRDAFLSEYFNELRRMIAGGWVNVIGHLDIYKKFDHDGSQFPKEAARPFVEAFLDHLAAIPTRTRPVLELNTAGFSKECREAYPDEEIARSAVERGIEFTMGSDSHSPEQVNRNSAEGTAILQRCGVKRLAFFIKRKRMRKNLPS
ncbi:MAG TPA: histidinol-phosphatase [Candidatus Brocadiia bacterium]|nr:histidinol-phosphatase [Candidatus Brocadiia bacterium]